jgi:hypothetical protein
MPSAWSTIESRWHLSAPMREWWSDVTAKYDLDPHHYYLLRGAAEAWDRLQQAGAALRNDGLTYVMEGKLRARPDVAIERDARIGFARLLRKLGLDQADAEKHRSGLGITWQDPQEAFLVFPSANFHGVAARILSPRPQLLDGPPMAK